MSGAVLGVVLAGGQSRRFGSDKALAEFDGQTLLARAVAALSQWCELVVVAGRDEAPARTIADRPGPDMGPLGGLAGGLHFARAHGFAAILTCGVDSLGLPHDLSDTLAPGPAFVESQPVVGLWPVDALPALEQILTGEGRNSMLAFANAIGARPVQLAMKPANINTPADLAEAEKQHGL